VAFAVLIFVRFDASFLAAPPPLSSPAEQSIEELYQRAHKDFTKGNYGAAAQEFRALVKLRPDSPQLWNDLGVAYSMAGNREAAVKAFEKALQLDPTLLPADLMLGVDLVHLGKPREAIPLFERVLQKRPSDRSSLSGLASAYLETHQFDKAAEVYKRETLLKGNDGAAWYGLGLCFEHIAEDSAQKLGQHARNSAYYHELVGQFLTNEDTDISQQGAGIDAVTELRRALSLPGGETEGFQADLGFAQLRLGEISQASQNFKKELRAYPGSLDGKLGLAEVAATKKNFSEAVRSICEIYRSDLGFYMSHQNLLADSIAPSAQSDFVSYLQNEHSPPECTNAVESLKKSLNATSAGVDPVGAFKSLSEVAKQGHFDRSNADLLMIKARSEFKDGHYTRCMQNLAGISGLNESDTVLLSKCAFLSGHFLVAYEAVSSSAPDRSKNIERIYWKAESAKRASQSAFQTAVRLSPNSWVAHVLLGDIYIQRKKWDSAMSEYKQAEKLKPGSPASYLGLGTVYWRNGQNSLAIPMLRTALKLDRQNIQANFEMGDILVREHRFSMAVPYLKRTVRGKPDFLPVHADLGKVYLALGNVREATNEILKALPMDHGGDLHYQLYVAYKKQGMTKLAQHALAESQRLRADALRSHQERLEKAFHLANDDTKAK
jgi:tetratricopeptide (TPR) repeat protein